MKCFPILALFLVALSGQSWSLRISPGNHFVRRAIPDEVFIEKHKQFTETLTRMAESLSHFQNVGHQDVTDRRSDSTVEIDTIDIKDSDAELGVEERNANLDEMATELNDAEIESNELTGVNVANVDEIEISENMSSDQDEMTADLLENDDDFESETEDDDEFDEDNDEFGDDFDDLNMDDLDDELKTDDVQSCHPKDTNCRMSSFKMEQASEENESADLQELNENTFTDDTQEDFMDEAMEDESLETEKMSLEPKIEIIHDIPSFQDFDSQEPVDTDEIMAEIKESSLEPESRESEQVIEITHNIPSLEDPEAQELDEDDENLMDKVQNPKESFSDTVIEITHDIPSAEDIESQGDVAEDSEIGDEFDDDDELEDDAENFDTDDEIEDDAEDLDKDDELNDFDHEALESPLDDHHFISRQQKDMELMEDQDFESTEDRSDSINEIFVDESEIGRPQVVQGPSPTFLGKFLNLFTFAA